MLDDHPDVDSARASEQTAAAYLAHYDWQLLDQEEFAHRVRGRLDSDATIDPHRIALQVYTEALYQACSGVEGHERQERGYIELFRYLYRRAEQRYPEVSADATQRAIETIHRTFDHCRQPVTFLAFALQKLRDAYRAELRLADSGVQSLDMLAGDQRAPQRDRLPITDLDPAEYVLRRELRQSLRQCAREYLERRPRTAQQIAVLWLKYIEGFDDITIGRLLGKPVSSVHVLRSRGLAKLRGDPGWQALARDLDLDQPGRC